MAGFGVASAIVGLISTAAKLSQAVIDVAGKYKDARKQIESFGIEVGILGHILDQFQRVLGKHNARLDQGVQGVTGTIFEQCTAFFSELESYKDSLHSRQGAGQSLTIRGKTKWVFDAKELEYLRTRCESMKMNMLLMMNLQCMNSTWSTSIELATRDLAEQTRLLSHQSEECASRLQIIESSIAIPASDGEDPIINRLSISTVDSAGSARSTRDSILSLYGHKSYIEKILAPRQGTFYDARDDWLDPSRASKAIESHIVNAEHTHQDDDRHENEPNTNENRVYRNGQYDGSETGGSSSDATEPPIHRTQLRASPDDQTSLILSKALKNYNTQLDGRHYPLYVAFNDGERFLRQDEKPLPIFKDLDKQGKKPMLCYGEERSTVSIE